jgi:hypothetical protein
MVVTPSLKMISVIPVVFSESLLIHSVWFVLTLGTLIVTLLNPLQPKNWDKVVSPEDVCEVEMA